MAMIGSDCYEKGKRAAGHPSVYPAALPGLKDPAHRASKMKPSEALQLHREAIRRVVERNDACNPRIFGSVLHGDDTDGSDLDILVDPIDGRTSLVSLVRIKRELEQLLGVRADIQTPMSLHERFRQAVLQEAIPV